MITVYKVIDKQQNKRYSEPYNYGLYRQRPIYRFKKKGRVKLSEK